MNDNTPQQQHLNTLVNKLLPLVTTALMANNETKEKHICECKCAQQLAALQTSNERLHNAVKGYKDQVETWKTKVQTLQKDVNELNKETKQVKSSVHKMTELQQKLSKKIDKHTKSHAELKKTIQEVEEKNKIIDIVPDLKNEVKTLLHEVQEKSKALGDTPDLNEIKQSQAFNSEQFEKMKKDNKDVMHTISEGRGQLENQIQEVAQELEFNIRKTCNNSQYTREECLTVDGISEDKSVFDSQGKVDPSIDTCKESKKAVIEFCKELNLNIDPFHTL